MEKSPTTNVPRTNTNERASSNNTCGVVSKLVIVKIIAVLAGCGGSAVGSKITDAGQTDIQITDPDVTNKDIQSKPNNSKDASSPDEISQDSGTDTTDTTDPDVIDNDIKSKQDTFLSPDSGMDTTISQEKPCTSVQYCPQPYKTFNDYQDNNYYLNSGRWIRIDPVTGITYKVCEPLKGKICDDNETPATDNCLLPECEDSTTCDPIPAKATKDAPERYPDQANFATSVGFDGPPFPMNINENNFSFPVIYDNIPDCEPNEEPVQPPWFDYGCDLIPTCEQTIPYCDPLPRCKPNQSPIHCQEQNLKLGDAEMCWDKMDAVDMFFMQAYGLDFPYYAKDKLCEPNPNGDISPPRIVIDCLPTPECKDGEFPEKTTAKVEIDCYGWWEDGDYYSWTSENENSMSCDPIKSCE